MSRAARSPADELAVTIRFGDTGLDAELGAILTARGLAHGPLPQPGPAGIESAIGRGDLVAWVIDDPIGLASAAALAPSCAAAARAGRPVVALAAPPREGGRARPGPRSPAIDRAAALAHLVAAGAVIVDDPDVWIEAIVLCAAIGVPAGPRAAVVAAPDSWLERSARALGAEAAARGGRGPAMLGSGDDLAPTDAVVVDVDAAAPEPRHARALIVPVAPRAELAGDRLALHGVRAALAAIGAVGQAAARAALGTGPAPLAARDGLEIDAARVGRQLDKLLDGDERRVGDHEAKVLLAAYGVPITRQAVATTPSAAVRIAKKAGFPVELKPWGAEIASERAGCPVERGIATASEVRRAFLAVLGAAGLPVGEADGAAVIVREAPPAGREVYAWFEPLGPLGWTCVVEVAGGAPAAAPAPLRLVDAERLASAVAATRAGEAEPDRAGLANLLRRASHLAVDHGDRFARVELGTIVLGGRGGRTLVVDAAIELRDR